MDINHNRLLKGVAPFACPVLAQDASDRVMLWDDPEEGRRAWVILGMEEG